MENRSKSNKQILAEIERYALTHPEALLEIVFSEGETYKCLYETNDWEDNGEDPDSPNYQEWLVLDFLVKQIVKPGPNKDSQFDYICISEKNMPSMIKSGTEILYDAQA